MKIAYISYEYPPDTAFGGISTYVDQVSKMMYDRGHHVEVFCASTIRTIQENKEEVQINRILCADRRQFSEKIVGVFTERHLQEKFDIIESPEYSADGIEIKNKFPQLPMVVKLHTPWFLILGLNHYYLNWYKKYRYLIAGLVKGQIRKRYWVYKKKEQDPDYLITIKADQIQTPSIALGDIIAKEWGIKREEIFNVPNPFSPQKNLLDIPVETNLRTVSFIGRLEMRKGVAELVKALPEVFERVPDFKMCFIGKVESSPQSKMNMKDYIALKLKKYLSRIEFKQFDGAEIYLAYANTDICVFPSLWENFPNVCLEAMSAGRAVVASKFGGMSDMIVNRHSGLLLNPFDKKELAEAIVSLLNDQSLRALFGKNAREAVLTRYNKSVIGELMEKNYHLAIHGINNRFK